MPLQIPCPCGKTLKVPDNLAGKKVKCPACEEIIDVPASPPPPVFDPDVVFDEIASSPRPPKPAAPTETVAATNVTGGTAIMLPGGFVLPSPFRKDASLLTLDRGRLMERSRRLIGTRQAELVVKHIDSVEISSRGNAAFLIVGVLALGLYGIGLLFLLLYAVWKSQYLIVRSGSNAIAIRVTFGSPAYEALMESLLQQAAR